MTRDKPLSAAKLPFAKLEDARRYPGYVVMLGCTICTYAKGYMVEKIILRLGETGAGGFQTPVADVAKMVKRVCPNCKGRDWITQFAYPAQLLERDLKRMKVRDGR